MSTQPSTRSLPDRPDLHQLKRQAKELLAAFQAGSPDAVGEVASHYRGADASTFALHDAQLVLARAYGFDSWPKLKAFVDGATVSRLIEAVRAGETSRVEAMLQARPEIINMVVGGDIAASDEHRALHHAVLARDTAMVRLLMAHDADAHIGIYPHRVPTTAWAIATERGYDDIVAIIREAEATRGHVSRYASASMPPPPPEFTAALNNGDERALIAFLESSPLLREHPELINSGPDDTSLLHLAAARLMPEVASWVLARGANVNARSGAVTFAVRLDRPEVLSLHLDLGLDAEERGRVVGGDEVYESRGVPLERAAGTGSLAMAQLLLDHGADPNGMGERGGAMAVAYRRKDRAMLELLTRAGGVVSAGTAAHHGDIAIARQRIAEEDAGRLPLGAVSVGGTVAQDLLHGDCGEPEIIRMALARIDWPPDDPRWYGAMRGPLSFWSYVPWIVSPLWQPRRSGYLESFQLLLARCHANVGGSLGRTILHDVIAMGFHDGASGWITEDEALAFAVTLLDAGARTDVRDELLKSTPLGWACRWGRAAIVRELLRRGVNPIEPDAESWATPRAWAEKMGHREIVAMIDAAVRREPL